MLQILLCLTGVFVVYLVAVHAVVKYTMDKMGAGTGMLGAGLVNIVAGFLLHDVVDLFIGFYLYDLPSLLYLVFRFGFLILGISGIIMVAVDLLRTIQGMGGYISRVEDKIKKSNHTSDTEKRTELPAWERIQMDSENVSAAAKQKEIPTWKRIQMDNE